MLVFILALLINTHKIRNIETISYPSGYQVIEADYNTTPIYIGYDHHIYTIRQNTNK